MRVDDHIHIGEANHRASPASERLSGNGSLNTLIGAGLGLAAVLAGMSAASVASDMSGEGWLYIPVLLATTGPLLIALVRWLQTRFVRRFRRKLISRGVSDPLPWMISVEIEGLRTRLGGVETRASWAAISEIFSVGPYWVLLVQGAATFVPKRHFTGAGQEKAFVAAVLDHLTPEARGRSGEAAAFAASQAPAMTGPPSGAPHSVQLPS